MFTTYEALQEQVASWLKRSSLADQIPAMIWLAEIQIVRECQLRQYEVVETGTFDTTGTLQLPDDYYWMQHFWTDARGGGTIEPATRRLVYEKRRYDNSGIPRIYVLEGNELTLGPIPSDGHGYELRYNAGPDHLAENNASNELLLTYPDLLLFKTLMLFAPYMAGDERIAAWKLMYDDAKGAVKMMNRRARQGSGRQRSRVSPSRVC